jgi:UDPglucose 6-dehydrogenase
MNISVIGLGKLGLCTAACFAAKGHRVIGFDKDEYIVDELQAKRCPINETGMEELLETAWKNLTITTIIENAVLNSEITLIIVPTPSQPDGKFSNKYVENVLQTLAPVLKEKEEFHVVDVVSTVMPGSSDKCFKPLLENMSGKVCGRDFGLVYNPEFIALGSVIRDFLNPDMVLIGASDKRSGDMVKELYLSTCESNPEIKVMSLVNAEIAKLSLNCFVTMKISFANELASICERVPGADIDAITNALGADTRIGSKYLKGGLGFGGPCFPRDNQAFQAFARESGVEPRLGQQVVAINNAVVDRLFDIISKQRNRNDRIALLGLSYKAGTCIIEESQSIALAQKLVQAGYLVALHDPKAMDITKAVLGEKVHYFDDPYTAAQCADAVVLLTDSPLYQRLDWQRLEQTLAEDALLLDCWRIAGNRSWNQAKYMGLGLGKSPYIQA